MTSLVVGTILCMVGFLVARTMAAIGALAADQSIEVEREIPDATGAGVSPPAS